MKRVLLVSLVAGIFLMFAAGAFAQAVVYPDPCSYDFNSLVGPGKPFQNIVNNSDGYYRLPISIVNMGYWDGSGVWHWWTNSTFPSCLRSTDGYPSNLFYDPDVREGTAIMPMCKNFPCSQYKRYNYRWWVYNNDPITTPRMEYSATNFEFRNKHYEDGSSKLYVIFRAGLNVMIPQYWWEPNKPILDSDPSSNVAWGIVVLGEGSCPSSTPCIPPPHFYADPYLSRQLTLGDIQSAIIQEETTPNTWETVVTQDKILPDADSRYQLMSMNYDANRSWWSPYDLSNVPDNTESSMKIDGWLPTPSKKYRLVLKLKNGADIVSNPYSCPNYFDLGFIPSKTQNVSITTKKGKVIDAGTMVNAIFLTEKDGKLIVQYTEPELFSLYDSGIPQASPPAPNINGSHVRIGLFVVNTPQLTKGAWIRVPAHLGTVVVPQDVIAWLKSQPEYSGRIDIVIHQRDNYFSGFNRYYTNTITYRFTQ